jgi:hypothetical protein
MAAVYNFVREFRRVLVLSGKDRRLIVSTADHFLVAAQEVATPKASHSVAQTIAPPSQPPENKELPTPQRELLSMHCLAVI